jgi:hypothetical protein
MGVREENEKARHMSSLHVGTIPQLVLKWKIFNKGACEHGELNGDSENKMSFGTNATT